MPWQWPSGGTLSLSLSLSLSLTDDESSRVLLLFFLRCDR